MTAASVPTGTKRCCEIQGQERHQGDPAELTPKRYPNMTNGRGVVCPVRDTKGLFRTALWPYFKIYKPKHQAPDLEDDYCEYEEEAPEEVVEDYEETADEDTPPWDEDGKEDEH